LLVTIDPDEEARPRDDCAQEGEEFAYVLSGELVFTMDDVEHTLEARRLHPLQVDGPTRGTERQRPARRGSLGAYAESVLKGPTQRRRDER
jgi:hypothetical protein